MPTAAIYARKSIETDKGESIENQISRGIALCQLQGWDYIIYQDYGISGKTLDRPDFERMMKDAHTGKIEYIVCYKIDRISRSVSDFSNFIEELNKLSIGFICIRDNFDTTTPMGRAMMMITSVFAQLERETIAERVKDNMIDRAKIGKWNGGPVPLGFSVESETLDLQGRKKKISRLVINDDEAELVRKIFEMYLEDKSIRLIGTKLNNLGIKTKNGSYWSDNQVSRILQNPLYCIADQVAYDYFNNHTDVQIVNRKEEYDDSVGLMYYNRRKEHNSTSTKLRNENEWILAIGEQQGIIPGEMYRNVQLLIKSNKIKAPRTGTSAKTPLQNVKCDLCGYSMSVYSSRNDASSPYVGYFRCNKNGKLGVKCANKNVRIDLVEKKVVEYISSLYDDEKTIVQALNAANENNDNKRIPLISERQKLNAEIDSVEKEIKNLVAALGKQTLPEILIQERYKELQKQKAALQDRLNEVNEEIEQSCTEAYSIEHTMKYIKTFKDSYYNLDFDEKRNLLNGIIKEVRINNDKLILELYFLPSSVIEDPAFCSYTDKGLSN
ncbi:MAG TPA: recombinase family protein [Negativicutes bacterium]|nr:recombinase family protein [Negativicutes bacterium]